MKKQLPRNWCRVIKRNHWFQEKARKNRSITYHKSGGKSELWKHRVCHSQPDITLNIQQEMTILINFIKNCAENRPHTEQWKVRLHEQQWVEFLVYKPNPDIIVQCGWNVTAVNSVWRHFGTSNTSLHVTRACNHLTAYGRLNPLGGRLMSDSDTQFSW